MQAPETTQQISRAKPSDNESELQNPKSAEDEVDQIYLQQPTGKIFGF